MKTTSVFDHTGDAESTVIYEEEPRETRKRLKNYRDYTLVAVAAAAMCLAGLTYTSVYFDQQSVDNTAGRRLNIRKPITASRKKHNVRNLVSTSNNQEVVVNENDDIRLYVCGNGVDTNDARYSYGGKMLLSVFPEINPESTPILLQTSNDFYKENPVRPLARINDILLIYDHNGCLVDPDTFPGKTLFISGQFPQMTLSNVYETPPESMKTISKERFRRTFFIGSNQDTYRSLQVPYATLWINSWGMDVMEKLFNHDFKPRNNGDRFLAYAASTCRRFREEAFDELADLAFELGTKVHADGKCWGLKHDEQKVDHTQLLDRLSGANYNPSLFQNYRFALVMENADRPGYITEKIVNAYLGGSIPIYYGTRQVFDIFNPKSFVFYDKNDPGPALAQIQFLETNPVAYQAMLDEPILANGRNTINRWFSFSDRYNQSGYLKKRIRSMMGYESAMFHFQLVDGNSNDRKDPGAIYD